MDPETVGDGAPLLPMTTPKWLTELLRQRSNGQLHKPTCCELVVIDKTQRELMLKTPRLEGGAGESDAERQLHKGLCAAVYQLNEFMVGENWH